MQRDNYKIAEGKLYNYKKNILRIQNLALEIEKIKNDTYSIGAVGYEERISGTTLITSSVENEIIRRDEKITVLERRKKQLEYEMQQIENVLEFLSDEESKIIRERYFNGKTYLQMTVDFPYSIQGMSSAVKKIVKKIAGALIF